MTWDKLENGISSIGLLGYGILLEPVVKVQEALERDLIRRDVSTIFLFWVVSRLLRSNLCLGQPL
jgi:hypothetical protein